ncbi:hypothetical protein XENTR_v10009420, partial [Xenopus tropicalis]
LESALFSRKSAIWCRDFQANQFTAGSCVIGPKLKLLTRFLPNKHPAYVFVKTVNQFLLVQDGTPGSFCLHQ